MSLPPSEISAPGAIRIAENAATMKEAISAKESSPRDGADRERANEFCSETLIGNAAKAEREQRQQQISGAPL
jgi:hypothetical protein